MGYNSARDAFFERVISQAEKEDVYIISADSAGRPFDVIREQAPQRFVSTGIAEQNMVSVACGLALCNKKVIAFTQAAFEDTRALDQIRNAVCMMNLPVAIVGLGIGFGTAECGNTHFVTEDYKILSSCPNITIINIADDEIAEKAADYVLAAKGPVYLRIERESYKLGVSDIDFDKGFRVLRKGTGVAILTAGYLAEKAYNINFSGHLSPTIIDVFGFSFNIDELMKILCEHRAVVVYEEHQRSGGLGSAVLEIFNDRGIANIAVERMGIDYKGDFPRVYGSREYWLKHFGLSVENLREVVDKLAEQ